MLANVHTQFNRDAQTTSSDWSSVLKLSLICYASFEKFNYFNLNNEVIHLNVNIM